MTDARQARNRMQRVSIPDIRDPVLEHIDQQEELVESLREQLHKMKLRLEDASATATRWEDRVKLLESRANVAMAVLAGTPPSAALAQRTRCGNDTCLTKTWKQDLDGRCCTCGWPGQ